MGKGKDYQKSLNNAERYGRIHPWYLVSPWWRSSLLSRSRNSIRRKAARSDTYRLCRRRRDSNRKISFQSKRFAFWHNGLLFTRWPTFGNDAPSGKVLLTLAVALDTRRMEIRKKEVHGWRFSYMAFSMVKNISKCPRMVRTLIVIKYR